MPDAGDDRLEVYPDVDAQWENAEKCVFQHIKTSEKCAKMELRSGEKRVIL